MKRTLFLYALFVALLMTGLSLVSHLRFNTMSAVVGAGVFTLNLLLISFLGHKMFGRGSSGDSEPSVIGGGAILLALAMKVFGLGLLIFLSLITFKLDPAYFVAGAAIGLVALVATALVSGFNLRKGASEVLAA